MDFNQWLSLYRKANYNETRVSLLSYLEQGNVSNTKKVSKEELHFKLINSILKRVRFT